MQVLVTGASGFVGRHLIHKMVDAGHAVTCVVRRGASVLPGIDAQSVSWVEVDDIADEHDWAAKLCGVEAVVHLAARVHVMKETTADPLAQFRRVNVLGSQRLAEAAAAVGVKRFVFLSSIKVNGERTADRPFRADDTPAPVDHYAASKLEAERQLWRLAGTGPTEFVVIRPPLVYGAGVKGNFARLVKLVLGGLPLPLGSLHSARSMVSVGNLTDFILHCLVHPKAADQVFLVSDGADWSTAELATAIAAALERRRRLFPLPPRALKWAATLIGRGAVADRLCDPLQVDIRKNYELLQWSPVESRDLALRDTVRSLAERLRSD